MSPTGAEAADFVLHKVRALETNNALMKKELEFYKTTEKGKLQAAYIRLWTFTQLVSDFCDNDSDGHMQYLHDQAEIAMEEAGES